MTFWGSHTASAFHAVHGWTQEELAVCEKMAWWVTVFATKD